MADTLTARVWREQPQRYRMIGNKDKATGKVYFPPRQAVPGNLNPEMEEFNLSGTGEVVACTVIRVAPTPFTDLAPYGLAVIETPDGVKLTAQITDVPVEDVKIGLKVKFEFRRIFEDNDASVIYYGYKAVPM
ncbi:Zn-ribbon domain-containing OB-fold protein [bacterium]|nr:Zn-ribbon domain-containing OB-fold protein [bacterium]